MKKLLFLLFLLPALAFADPVEEYRGSLSVGPDAHISTIVMEKVLSRKLTVTDNDAQNNTLTVAELVGGITVHTSVTGAGTITTDTAANIIAGSNGSGKLAENNQCYEHWYVNDGGQTLTFSGGTGVTIADVGQTIVSNEAALLLICRTSSTAVTLYIIGA
jgi:hypothetical protein